MKKIFFSLSIVIGLSNCQKEKITLSGNANDTFFLQEKGISMPIQVRGNVASKKMIIVLHGGPGGVALLYRSQQVIDRVEKEFAMVYYDQRLSGASQGNSSSNNISLFKSDLLKIIQLLKSKYGSDTKMYLMGHSWGGFVAPYFLEDGNNQNQVSGWIQVAGAHNYRMTDSLTREMLISQGIIEIAANRNTDKWKPIVDVLSSKPFDGSDDIHAELDKYSSAVEAYVAEITPPSTPSLLSQIIKNRVAGSAALINGFIGGKLKDVDAQAFAVPISENLYKIKVPTLLLFGKYDFVCPTGLSDDIKAKVGSADVTEKIFQNSGHSPMDNETVLFWQTLVGWVKTH